MLVLVFAVCTIIFHFLATNCINMKNRCAYRIISSRLNTLYTTHYLNRTLPIRRIVTVCQTYKTNIFIISVFIEQWRRTLYTISFITSMTTSSIRYVFINNHPAALFYYKLKFKITNLKIKADHFGWAYQKNV